MAYVSHVLTWADKVLNNNSVASMRLTCMLLWRMLNLGRARITNFHLLKSADQILVGESFRKYT